MIRKVMHITRLKFENGFVLMYEQENYYLRTRKFSLFRAGDSILINF